MYDAWALLAKAEGQSRTEPAIVGSTLEVAVGRFTEAEKALSTQMSLERLEEEQSVETQRVLLNQGRRYAETRLRLERARSLERSGQFLESIEQLAAATRSFDALADEARDVETRDSMRSYARLSHASQVMLQAEQSLQPELYAEAAVLFQEIQKKAKTRPLALASGGWAACCKGLELGLRYRQTSDRAQFEALKKDLANAHSYFTDAGATTTAAWVTGTGRMFDAIALHSEAEPRLDPDKRKRLYDEAEKNIRVAAQMFERAGYVARHEDTLRYLHSTLEQRQAVPTASMPAAPVVQSVSDLATQTITQELLLGSEVVSSPSLQAALVAPTAPLQVDKQTELSLTVLNTGQGLAILVRIESLGQRDLEFQSDSSELPLIEGSVELHGKRLPPLTSQEFHFRVKPRRAGQYALQPRVLAVNPQGELIIQPVRTLTLAVYGGQTSLGAEPRVQAVSHVEKEEMRREEVGSPQADRLLLGGIPAGYAVVLSAPPSDEARTIIRSFILRGLSSDQNVLYITRDPSLLANIQKDKLAKLSVLSIGDAPKGPSQVISTRLPNPTELLIESSKLLRTETEFKQRACIDILSDMLLQHGPLNTRKWVSDLIRRLKANGYTTLAVLDPTLHESREAQAVTGIFDGEMEIGERDSDGRTGRFLRVKRMYDTPHSQDRLLLT